MKDSLAMKRNYQMQAQAISKSVSYPKLVLSLLTSISISLAWIALTITIASAQTKLEEPSTPQDTTNSQATATTQDRSVWRQWRGPMGTGESPDANPPISWSEEENVRWKTALPGLGHSSPVVSGDLIFVTSAEPIGEKFTPIPDNRPGSHDNLKVSQKHRYLVMAIDRASGKIRWTTEVNQNVPHEGGHETGSLASASPITDGKRVYASFGSNGIYALDFDGKIVWQKQLGLMHSKHGHGEGASPTLYENQIFVNWDHEGDSFLAAFDAATGNENWRVPRKEVTSWASPIVAVVEGKPQVIVAGTDRIRGYNTTNGDVIWECGGLSANVVATPLFSEGILFAASSYDTRAMLAIDLRGASGDLTGTDRVLWSTSQKTPYIPSPLLYRGQIYYLRHYQGILSRVVARTGEEEMGPFRIGGFNEIYASPVAAADRIYITNRQGTTVVLSHSQMPKTLSVNQLDDSFSASAAMVGDQLFLRGEKFLYALQDLAQPHK